jgi:hypothetical protein
MEHLLDMVSSRKILIKHVKQTLPGPESASFSRPGRSRQGFWPGSSACPVDISVARRAMIKRLKTAIPTITIAPT